MSPTDIKEIEKILSENSLPKINMRMYSLFKLLGNREKKEFIEHDLNELIKEIKEKESEYAEQVKNVTNYLEHLKVDKIVTPVRKIAEFIESDLLMTDPKFLGSIIDHYQRTDIEHKKVTNSPITGKIAWMKIIAILAIAGMIIGVGYYIYESGTFSNGIPGLSFSNKPTSEQLMKQYSTPEAMRAALDSGKLKYDELPPDIQKMIDKVKVPTITP